MKSTSLVMSCANCLNLYEEMRSTLQRAWLTVIGSDDWFVLRGGGGCGAQFECKLKEPSLHQERLH